MGSSGFVSGFVGLGFGVLGFWVWGLGYSIIGFGVLGSRKNSGLLAVRRFGTYTFCVLEAL